MVPKIFRDLSALDLPIASEVLGVTVVMTLMALQLLHCKRHFSLLCQKLYNQCHNKLATSIPEQGLDNKFENQKDLLKRPEELTFKELFYG